LQFLLGQKPGYFAHHKTIAEAVESSTTPIREALSALREAGLVFWELIPPHHALPTGQFTRTNVNRYWVNVRHLLSLLGSENVTPTTGPKSGASTQPNSDASTGKDLRSEQDPPSTPPQSEQVLFEHGPSGKEASSQTDQKRESTQEQTRVRERTDPVPAGNSPRKCGVEQPRRRETGKGDRPELAAPAELKPILAAWRELKLGAPDGRSIRALVNRNPLARSVASFAGGQ
jgi:hypothetical protein